MKTRITAPARSRRQQGFSLLEMLLVATLMTAIIYGLYSMFDQTQKALRSNSAQVDVQEAGRAGLEYLAREIEQAGAARLSSTPNLFYTLYSPSPDLGNRPVRIPSLGTNASARCFVLQDAFFLKRTSNSWSATGFFVASYDNAGLGIGSDGVGTLYRFAPPLPAVRQLGLAHVADYLTRFYSRTNASPLVDGVVHFRLEAYDANGWPMVYDNRLFTNAFPFTLFLPAGKPLSTNLGRANVMIRQTRPPAYFESDLYCFSNALPAYLDIELGVLEPQAWERIKAMPQVSGAAAEQQPRFRYLTNHVGQIHLFRKRVQLHPSLP